MRTLNFLRRPPDVIIGSPEDPYLLRWWIIPRNRWFNIYLHKFMRSDDDRALHCHPWHSVRLLLRGRYLEHLATGAVFRWAGDIVVMRGETAHRVELVDGPVWTLFITGPKYRDWGFHCPQGWVHWRDFTKPGNAGEIGKGCEQ